MEMMHIFYSFVSILFVSSTAVATCGIPNLYHIVKPLGFADDSRFAYEWTDKTCACKGQTCQDDFANKCDPRGYILQNLANDKTESFAHESDLKKRIKFIELKKSKFPIHDDGDFIDSKVTCQVNLKDQNQDDNWRAILISKKLGTKVIGHTKLATQLGNTIEIEGYFRSPIGSKIAVLAVANSYEGDCEWGQRQIIFGADLKTGFSKKLKIEPNQCSLK